MRGLYKREDSETWYVLVYHQGKRVRASTGTTNKKQAQEFYDKFCADLRASAKRSSTTTWQDACVKWLTAEERSANDRYILRALEYEDRPLSDCTPDSFESALKHLSKSTYNRYRSIIVAIGNLSGHKINLPTKKTANARLRILTAEEWQTLHNELPEHLKPLAEFSIATGLRQSNVTQLKWENIDMKGCRMWVHADEAKGKKNIGIPLPPDAMNVLLQQEGKDKLWVFPYQGRGRKKQTVGPMTKVKTAWQLAMERAGLGRFERWVDDNKKKRKKWHGDFTWHGLRHTWASWHLMAGTPIEVLAKLGGWEDLRMVQKHYGHLATEHLAGYAGNALPWSRKNSHTKQPQENLVV